MPALLLAFGAFAIAADPPQAPPPSLPMEGLALWLRADAGVTLDGASLVSNWRDVRLGGGGCALAGEGGRPAVAAQACHDLPALHFGGAAVLTTEKLVTVRTVFVVARYAEKTFGAYPGLLGGPQDGVNAGHILNGIPGTERLGHGVSPAACFRCNGVEQPFTGSPAQADGGYTVAPIDQFWLASAELPVDQTQVVTIGEVSGGGRFWKGDIAEILIYSRILPADAVQAVTRYLMARYGLTAAPAGNVKPAPTAPTAKVQGTMQLTAPTPYQVIQRQGYQPAEDHPHQDGGPTLGFGLLGVSFAVPAGGAGWSWEYRALPLPDAAGAGVPAWTALPCATAAGDFHGTARVPAGGWYRLEVRGRTGETVGATAAVEPVGVGEVLLIAGQSYSEGCNEVLQRVTDPQGRVAAYELATHRWRIANDPLPNCHPGGTIWPPLGDLLVELLRVPVGLVDVGVGATSSRQWLPGQALYARLLTAGNAVGPCRFVLWQQGESDVIEGVDTDTYVKNLTAIRAGLVQAWGVAPPWLPAKSTMHPYVYQNPVGEARIRRAIDRLWTTPGFLPGPDTDMLGGDNRATLDKSGHFTAIGQRHAALLWFAAVWQALGK